MGNKLNRYDPATAIPLLEKEIATLSKGQGQLKEDIKNIDVGGGGASGENLYLVSIYATRGNQLRGGVESTTLQATLTSWDRNITDNTPAEYFTWTRNSGNSQADIVWNNANGKGKKNITVIKEDVGEQSTFLCTVNDNNKLYAQAQIVITSNYSIQDAVDEVTRLSETISAIETNATEAKLLATEAQTKANSALAVMDEVNAEIDAANNAVEKVKGDLTTLTETLKADYATKGDLTEIDTSLKAEIQKNAGQISSVITRVDDIEIDSSQAVADAQAAKTAAETAQDKADTAQRNYELLQQQANATDEQLAQAKADVETANNAAQLAKNTAETAQEAANSLTDRVVKAETDITQTAEAVTLLATNVEENYSTSESVANSISEAATQVLATAEEVVIGILSGYTTTSDLEAYKKEVQNLFQANEEGFSFEFMQLAEKLNEVGNEVTEQKQYIRLIEGEIHIGKADNPITSVYTNDALEFRYNGQMVARFTNEVLEVRNISVENQVAFFDQWAIRRGAYVDGIGYNLNDIWIGG